MQRKRGRGTGAIGDERARRPRAQLAEPGLVAIEDVVEHAGAARLGEELRAEPDEATGGDEVLHAHPAGAVVDHLLHAALAQSEQLRDDPEVLLGHVDGHALDGLVHLAVDGARDDLRLTDDELVALAAHELDEDGQLQLTAALDLPGVGALGVDHADRDVPDQLLVEPGLHLAGGELVTLLPGGWRGVDPDGHRQARLVDDDRWQRPGVLDVGERLTDGDLRDARDGHDVAGADLVGVDALEGLGDVQLGDFDLLDRPVELAPRDLLALLEVAVPDAAQREAAHVGGRVEVGDQRLERVVVLIGRRGYTVDQHVHEGPQVVGEVIGGEARLPVTRDAVQDREVDLVLAGVKVEEQLEDLVDDLLHAGVRPVDLVHDEHDRQIGLERLAQHETRLRQRPLGGVHEEHDAVDHGQPALDLAAEVGVAGGVDDVDLRLDAVRTSPAHRGVLREDRDALLALEVHGVHDALVDVLVVAEHPRLPEHRVDQGRLPVVDVGDDGDVADVVACGHGGDLFVWMGRADGGARKSATIDAARRQV